MDNHNESTENPTGNHHFTTENVGRILSKLPSIDDSLVLDAIQIAKKVAINAAVQGLDKLMENSDGKRAYTVVIKSGSDDGREGHPVASVTMASQEAEKPYSITANANNGSASISMPDVTGTIQSILENKWPDRAPYTPVSVESTLEGKDSPEVTIFRDSIGNNYRVETSVKTSSSVQFNNENNISIKNKTSPAPVEDNASDRAIRVEGTKIYYFRDRPELGFGATSVVYEGYHRCPHRPAAVKKFREDCNDVYERELKVWLALTKNQTPENLNIVQLFEYIPLRDETRKVTNYFLAMEMAKCDLNTRLEQLQKEPGNHFDRVAGYMGDVGDALKFLHGQQHKIIHRDIKPRNILLFEYNADGKGREIAKLADFGVSRILSYTISATNSVAAGTLNWMAPEALNALLDDELFENTCGMDIFSFGMTCHFTISLGRQHPFDIGRASISKNIRTASVTPVGLTAAVPNYVCANHLFGWMMSKAMDERERPLRPDIGQVMQHPFFWTPMKVLEFVMVVGSCLSTSSGDDGNNMRKQIDDNFLLQYCAFSTSPSQSVSNFDWTAILGDRFYNMCRIRKSGPDGQLLTTYNGSSLMSYVDLIVNMITQYNDLVDEVVQNDETLGTQLSAGDAVHSHEKFGFYLLNKIPGALMCLYSTLMEMDSACAMSLKETLCLK